LNLRAPLRVPRCFSAVIVFLTDITAEDPEVLAEDAEKKLKSGSNSFDARFALRYRL